MPKNSERNCEGGLGVCMTKGQTNKPKMGQKIHLGWISRGGGRSPPPWLEDHFKYPGGFRVNNVVLFIAHGPILFDQISH